MTVQIFPHPQNEVILYILVKLPMTNASWYHMIEKFFMSFERQNYTVPTVHTHTPHHRLTTLCPGLPRWAGTRKVQAQLSPRNCAMRRVNWNLANCHATVQKLLIRQVLTKSMVWSWRFSRRQCVIDNVHTTMTRPSRFHCLRCVINKLTTDDLWISPAYRRLAVAKFSKSTI